MQTNKRFSSFLHSTHIQPTVDMLTINWLETFNCIGIAQPIGNVVAPISFKYSWKFAVGRNSVDVGSTSSKISGMKIIRNCVDSVDSAVKKYSSRLDRIFRIQRKHTTSLDSSSSTDDSLHSV